MSASLIAALFFTVALLVVKAYFLLGSVPLLVLNHDTPLNSSFVRSFINTYYSSSGALRPFLCNETMADVALPAWHRLVLARPAAFNVSLGPARQAGSSRGKAAPRPRRAVRMGAPAGARGRPADGGGWAEFHAPSRHRKVTAPRRNPPW